MASRANVSLTDTEVSHIKSLVYRNISNGEYFGNKQHYWARSDSILAKMIEAEDKFLVKWAHNLEVKDG